MPASNRLPVYFVSHGGGPWPWMEGMVEGPYAKLAASLRRMPADVGPDARAMLMVSAHWEAPQFTVQAKPQPGMLYDYGGFPEHTYKVRYPAAGDPALAARAQQLLHDAGIASASDSERDYDHGMFSPMAVAWPNADLPVVQLSLKAGLDPAEHLAAGRALAPLRDEGVLVVGSGLSYHNLRAFGPAARQVSNAFDGWLQQVMALPPQQRDAALLQWEQAPAARLAHPREEHLLPLMVAVGAAGNDPAQLVYNQSDFMGGVAASSYRFGAPLPGT